MAGDWRDVGGHAIAGWLMPAPAAVLYAAASLDDDKAFVGKPRWAGTGALAALNRFRGEEFDDIFTLFAAGRGDPWITWFWVAHAEMARTST